MGACAMTVIHHGLCHPDITAQQQRRPADFGHAARGRGGKKDNPQPPTPPPPAAAKQILPPPRSLTHNQTHSDRCRSHAHMSLIVVACIPSHKHLFAHVHAFTREYIPEIYAS